MFLEEAELYTHELICQENSLCLKWFRELFFSILNMLD